MHIETRAAPGSVSDADQFALIAPPLRRSKGATYPLLQDRGSERTGRRPVVALYVLAENRDWRSAHGPQEITRRPQVRLALETSCPSGL
jgi:hypothetical protein